MSYAVHVLRFVQDSFQRPLLKALGQASVTQSEHLRKIGAAHYGSPILNPNSAAPVYGLLLSSSPFTVIRCVALVVVNSLQSVLRGALSKICIEVFKRIPPSLTNRNTSSPILRVCGSVLIVATLKHRRPRTEFRRVGHTMGSAGATARGGIAGSQVRPSGDDLFPAIADTVPEGVPTPIGLTGNGKNGQPPVFAADSVNESESVYGSLIFGHLNLRNRFGY